LDRIERKIFLKRTVVITISITRMKRVGRIGGSVVVCGIATGIEWGDSNDAAVVLYVVVIMGYVRLRLLLRHNVLLLMATENFIIFVS